MTTSNPLNDGGPLFPSAGYPGISARDYFAAEAMKAIIAKSGLRATHQASADVKLISQAVAIGAVAYADALIAELQKPTHPAAPPA